MEFQVKGMFYYKEIYFKLHLFVIIFKKLQNTDFIQVNDKIAYILLL
jgi:hypothetical protein